MSSHAYRQQRTSRGARTIMGLLIMALMGAATTSAAADDDQKQKNLVDRARITLESFLTDHDMTEFHRAIREATGIFIMPQVLSAAAVIGVEGGSGVFLVRDEKTGEWSEPAFYTMGGASFGVQAGAQTSEVIFLILSKKGVDAMISETVTLGFDVSIDFVTGSRAGVATAPNLSLDMLIFGRELGAFLGVSFEGAVVTARAQWNADYYGRAVRPEEILGQHDIKNPHSAELRAVLAGATRAK